ncbi:dolichyl-diphosphooligosaccharide--protein glycosyltransferase subunit 1 [Eurytemora carolleeae]|uniref:dolichyl-diphosphooligosaccharide--protein glycosyltransferase subunit 1 n=1 Tax=Eurytemora carolleeae TaxID=1294199 RepID=UPI000C76943E|nr:dolichyl-diphosphooligosaccharide--protein glycosyltransferase subunit 1 [Eurytemora carolleeae]|eukprot:XP_023344065.1 dolichyl-diphosphooligosaccharide--protein glycosyltransferase subunit 1-like [Eurytemora affinis]
MLKFSTLLLLVGANLSFAAFDSINKDLVVKSCDRTIDLSSQLVKLNNKLRFVYISVIDVIGSCVEDIIIISNDCSNFRNKKKQVSETKVQAHLDKGFWKIELKNALTPGASVTVTVEVVLGGAQEMYPAAITQKEKQLTRYIGNMYVYLPYTVTTQSTSVILASANIESYTKLKPVTQQDSTIKYGPYSNIAPLTEAELVIHAENNNPMLVVTNLLRVIEVSMWGNIAVEETVDVRHSGAQLKGSFSRYEFQRESSGVSSVKNFKTLLPAAARDVYYRDDIGNISTSHMKVMDDAVELDLRPSVKSGIRAVLKVLKGLKVSHSKVLSSVYLSGDLHVLNMRLIDHLFDDMLIDDAEVRVILPEGVLNIELSTPYPVKRESNNKHYTYLDTTGRTVVVFKSIGGLTENHIQDFQLQFTFPHKSMLLEPLILVTAFFLLFMISIIYMRLDFSISVDEGAEVKMKVAGYCEKVANHQDRRSALYQAMEDAMVKLKSTKDTTAFQDSLKKIGAEQKTESNAIGDLQNTIKNINADLGEKVNELQRNDKIFREFQGQHAGLVEKLVTGKLQKAVYLDQEKVVLKKKEDILDKINALVRTL